MHLYRNDRYHCLSLQREPDYCFNKSRLYYHFFRTVYSYKLANQKYIKWHYTLTWMVVPISLEVSYVPNGTVKWFNCLEKLFYGICQTYAYSLSFSLRWMDGERERDNQEKLSNISNIVDIHRNVHGGMVIQHSQELETPINRRQKWLNKFWHTDTMEPYITVKGNKLLIREVSVYRIPPID